MRQGIVYLIGAGPGDPKLITLRGQECAARADVVVYDRLVSLKIVAQARPDAELIYVGKSPERHTLTQDEINRVLAEKAGEGKTVARLKGGDPFVFGRGGEEAEYLRELGIGFEVVPGITSAIAAPAYAGIPVTHRDFTSSFAVITGHEDPTKIDSSIAWDKLSTGSGTLVFLMGMENLGYIVSRLVDNGRSPNTPVALIRLGTRPEQEVLTGTLGDIGERAGGAGFKSPVVIIVGDVVSLREKLQWFEKRPLFGKRVLVTRTREQASLLAAAVEELGGEAWEFPVIKIGPPSSWELLDRALDSLQSYRWVVFTSANGVEQFLKRLTATGGDIRSLYGAKIGAIGPKTAECLQGFGLKVDYVPAEFRAEAVAEGLLRQISAGDRVLLPRAEVAREVLPQLLADAGVRVDEVPVYRTVTGDGNVGRVLELLRHRLIHVVTFTSSSTVRNLVQMIGQENLPLLSGVTLACIGPVTADTVRELGMEPSVVARTYTIDGLIQAILDFYHSPLAAV